MHRTYTRYWMLGAALILAARIHAAETTPLPAPEKPGPYAVGVTTMRFDDSTRTDATTKAPRVLMTEIWYPATEDARSLPKNRLMDFFERTENPELALVLQLGFRANIVEADKAFQNFAVRDARVADGLFPLLLFSHGNGGLRMQNAFWCEHMASHGYIVVAPDHTGNCGVTLIDGQLVSFDDSKEGREKSRIDRPKDLSFLIDKMDQFNKGGDSRFRGKLDLEHIGVAGHSFGGFTSVWMADSDPRVKAIAPMAGVAETCQNVTLPAMALIATEDDTLGLERTEAIRKFYDARTGPAYAVEFKNAGHYSFTEMYQLNPTFGDGVGKGKRLASGEALDYIGRDTAFHLTNAYTTAFFGKFLKGQTGYDVYLEANHDPKELEVKWKK